MSSSLQKRSATEAQLSNRPNKAARTNFNLSGTDWEPDTAMNATQEQAVAAKWTELSRRGRDTLYALGDAVSATISLIIPQWKAVFAFRDADELSLSTHTLSSRQSLALSTPTLTITDSSNSSKQHTISANNSPTKMLASSSSSVPSFYPPHQVPPSSSASSSAAELSRVSASAWNSTQTSLPNSPPDSGSGLDDTNTDAIRKLISKTNQDGLLGSGVGRKYKRKSHIHEGQHKERIREHLERLLYDRTRKLGYKSDFETFRGYVQYRQRLEELHKIESKHSYTSSRTSSPLLPQNDVEFFQRAMEKATKSLHSPRPPKPYSPKLDELTARSKSRNERIQNRLHPKRKPIPEQLPNEVIKEVKVLLHKRGVVSKAGREQVNENDLSRLMPGQWLNDEVINFYGQLIVDRAAEAEAAKENEAVKPLKVHYFSTFFWPKLLSGYEKGRLAKWTKKVDIFSKDIILMAVNHGNAHWTSAAIDFRRNRIISCDSMGFHRSDVYKALRSYLNEEHKNKKKKPFDFTGWEDYRWESYPEQENGYDCGVFTCQTLEYLSRGEAGFNFTQQNMPYLRQRMIWEIGRAKLGDPI